MLYIEVLLLAIGLSMDSLAVSVTGGAVLKNNCTAGNIIKIASVLGIFQAGMTVIGYTMGLEMCIRDRYTIARRKRRKTGNSILYVTGHYADWE